MDRWSTLSWILTLTLISGDGVSSIPNGCEPPVLREHSSMEPIKELYDTDEEIRFSCESGYKRTGGSVVTRCIGYPLISTWVWSGVPIVCSPDSMVIDCGELVIANASVGEPRSTSHGATASYTCNAGFTPRSGTAVCSNTSKWAYEPCKQEPRCPAPELSANLAANDSRSQFSIGESVSFWCMGGFQLAGSAVMRCVLNTMLQPVWSKRAPVCKVMAEEANKPGTLKSYAVPVAAGVSTAVILTIVLIFVLCCIHKRKLQKQARSSHSDNGSDMSGHTCVTGLSSQGSQRVSLEGRTSMTSAQSTITTESKPSITSAFTSLHQITDAGRCGSPHSNSTCSTDHHHSSLCNLSPVPLISPSVRAPTAPGSFRHPGRYVFSYNQTPNEAQATLPYPQHSHAGSNSIYGAPCIHCAQTTMVLPNNNTLPVPRPLVPISYEMVGREKEYHFYQPLEHIYEDPNILLRQQQPEQNGYGMPGHGVPGHGVPGHFLV